MRRNREGAFRDLQSHDAAGKWRAQRGEIEVASGVGLSGLRPLKLGLEARGITDRFLRLGCAVEQRVEGGLGRRFVRAGLIQLLLCDVSRLYQRLQSLER